MERNLFHSTVDSSTFQLVRLDFEIQSLIERVNALALEYQDNHPENSSYPLFVCQVCHRLENGWRYWFEKEYSSFKEEEQQQQKILHCENCVETCKECKLLHSILHIQEHRKKEHPKKTNLIKHTKKVNKSQNTT